MKTLVAILVLAMVACAFAQVAPIYNYGYTSHTPGARVSQYASSGYVAPHYGAYYGAYGAYGAYPYRVY